MAALSYVEAKEIADRRVCSDCWEHLLVICKKDETYLECSTPGCKFSGTISKRTRDILEANSRAEAWEARAALREALPWLQKDERRDPAELLKDLGF